MKAEVSISRIYDAPDWSLYFFTKQAYETFEELVRATGANNSEFAFRVLENTIEDSYDSLDAFAEDCHNLSVDELLENLGYATE